MRQVIYFLLIIIIIQTQLSAQWQNVQAVPNEIIYSLTQTNGVFIAGANNKVYLSVDNGSSWSASSIISQNSGSVEAAIIFKDHLFVGTTPVGVFKSTDGGASWMEFNNGFSGLGSNGISSFVNREGILYCSTFGAGVFYLDNSNGQQWIPYQDNFPVGISGTVTDMILNNGTLISSGGGNGYIYRNESGTTQWIEIFVFNPLPNSFVVSDLYSNDNFIFAGSNFKIHSSSDNGLTWNYLFNGLPNGFDYYLAGASGKIYTLTNGTTGAALFVSDNNGATWNYVNNINTIYVYEIEAVGDNLYAATETGLYYIPLSAVSVDDKPYSANDFKLYQNYPNPFNPNTKISWHSPIASWQTLKVYDLLGNLITVLIDEYKPAGSYTVSFNASELASGMYFYKLQIGNYSDTRKMLLLR
jgi:photosystem II stability/assembly factor-like uncharacterized protein